MIAASYAFSPAVLCDGAFWGQTDGFPVLFILLALLCALRGAGVWAGVLFGLAVMFKPQPAIFAPLILLYLWRWSGWKQALQAIGGMLGAALVICSPYLLPPSPGIVDFYENVQTWAAAGHASDNAFNLWFLLGARRSPTQPYFAFISPTSLGLLLFFAVLALVLFGVWKSRSAHLLFLGAALLCVAFFVVTTLQHERYLYPALVLALAAAVTARSGWFFYAVPSITLGFNMLLTLIVLAPYNFGLGSDVAERWGAVIIGAALALSLVNIWLLVRMVVVYLFTVRQLPAAWEARIPGAPADAPVLSGE